MNSPGASYDRSAACTPLQLTVRQDVSDGFRVNGDYDPNLAFERAGSVNVERKRNRHGQEEFEIQFVDKRFHQGKLAVINLDVDALFDLVQQACRTGWE